MDIVLGIIAVIVVIALMPVIMYAGFIVVTLVFGILMLPVAWMINLAEIVRNKKELTRKKQEFEKMKRAVEDVNKKFRQRIQ